MFACEPLLFHVRLRWGRWGLFDGSREVYRWLGDLATADAYTALGDAKQIAWQAELAAR